MNADRSKIISILIVEDDRAASDLIRRMIAMQFPELIIYEAEDGVVGEELFHRHAPDIVITDVSMPYKDGIEMATAIKTSSPGTRLIITSAYNDLFFLEKFKEIGIHCYLLKPLDLSELMTALQECLEEVLAADKPPAR